MASLKFSSLLVDGRNIDPSHFSQIEANTVRNERRSNATPALRGLLNRALGDLRDELKEDEVEKGQSQRSIAAYDSNIVAEVRRETQGRQKGVQRFVLEKQGLAEEDTEEQKDSGGQQDYKRKKIGLLVGSIGGAVAAMLGSLLVFCWKYRSLSDAKQGHGGLSPTDEISTVEGGQKKSMKKPFVIEDHSLSNVSSLHTDGQWDELGTLSSIHSRRDTTNDAALIYTQRASYWRHLLEKMERETLGVDPARCPCSVDLNDSESSVASLCSEDNPIDDESSAKTAPVMNTSRPEEDEPESTTSDESASKDDSRLVIRIF